MSHNPDILQEYFLYKIETGAQSLGLWDKKEYRDRLDYEIKIITSMGFSGYFLVVLNIIEWCRKNNIYVGPGRGSGAGSLVCYCLGITRVDPLEFDLIFERFLNPARVSMPDIDIDVERRYREKVIQYIFEYFDPENVSHIGTLGYMRAKSAIRRMCTVLGYPVAVGDKLSKLTLPPEHGKSKDLQTSIQKVKDLKSYIENKGTPEQEILEWALKAENLIESYGIHASGIVIAPNPIINYMPIHKGRKNERVTQWTMDLVEERGLIKFDFLGLDALTKIHECIDLIFQTTGRVIDIEKIPMDDQQTFSQLNTGHNIGVFQLEESSGMKELVMKMGIYSWSDIAAAVAIFRPGPLGSPGLLDYYAVREGLKEPEYLVPELEPILAPTNGFLIYQEQCMKIATDLCGETMAEADLLRKAIGKKKKKLMDEQKEKFLQGWNENGHPEDKGKQLWEQIVNFADYAFNKSHAVAYAKISYQMAWLKAHYPLHFMTALLRCEEKRDDIIKNLSECKRMGIKILPPDLNASKENFEIIGNDTIRFGLGAIKNVGKSMRIIEDNIKKHGSINSFEDFCTRIKTGNINRKKIECLIRAGAMDSFGHTRASLLNSLDDIRIYRDKLKQFPLKMSKYEDHQRAVGQRLKDIQEKKLSAKGNPLKPLKLKSPPTPPTVPSPREVKELEKTEIQRGEYELLGFFVSSHPLEDATKSEKAGSMFTIDEIKSFPDKTNVIFLAVITEAETKVTKRKQEMSIMRLEDMTSTIEAVCFPRDFVKQQDNIVLMQPLQIQGKIQQQIFVNSETGEETSITKVIVSQITKLNEYGSLGKIEEITLPLRDKLAIQVTARKYKNREQCLSLSLQAQDGTIFKLPIQVN